MDVDTNNLVLSQIAFPPAYTNLIYNFNVPFKPDSTSTPSVEILSAASNKAPKIIDLPLNLLKIIDANAIQNTSKFFKYEQLRLKFAELQLHFTTGTFPKHYKITINTHLKTVTQESLIIHSKTAILTTEIANVYSKATLIAGELAQSAILLLAKIMELTTNTSSLKNNKSLFYDQHINPFLIRWRSVINETIIKFEDNQIRHRNKKILEKEKKEQKRLAFQDSILKKDILLKTSSSPNFANNSALLQSELNKLHSKILSLEKQLSGNAQESKQSLSTPSKQSNSGKKKNKTNNNKPKPKSKKITTPKKEKSKETTGSAPSKNRKK